MSTPQPPMYGPGPGEPGQFGRPGYPPPNPLPPRRNRPVWMLAAVAVGALVVGGGVTAAFTLTGNSNSASPTVTDQSSNLGNATGSDSGNAAAATTASGSGPAINLKVIGDSISAISYVDANGAQRSVSNPSSGWSLSFDANSSFQEKLKVSGTGRVKCVLQIGDSSTSSAADDSGGSSTTCHGSVGN